MQRCFEVIACNEQPFPFRAELECTNGATIEGFSNRKVLLARACMQQDCILTPVSRHETLSKSLSKPW